MIFGKNTNSPPTPKSADWVARTLAICAIAGVFFTALKYPTEHKKLETELEIALRNNAKLISEQRTELKVTNVETGFINMPDTEKMLANITAIGPQELYVKNLSIQLENGLQSPPVKSFPSRILVRQNNDSLVEVINISELLPYLSKKYQGKNLKRLHCGTAPAEINEESTLADLIFTYSTASGEEATTRSRFTLIFSNGN